MHGSKFPFHALPNVHVTPHCSAWTDEMISRRSIVVADNIIKVFAGQRPVHVIKEPHVDAPVTPYSRFTLELPKLQSIELASPALPDRYTCRTFTEPQQQTADWVSLSM